MSGLRRAAALSALVATIGACSTEEQSSAQSRSGPPSEAELSRIVAEFTHAYVESDPDRPFSARFWGVPTWQNPCDLWVFQEILNEVRPDLVIETGTAHGGSTLYLAWVLDMMGLDDSRILTIDVEPQVEQASQHPLWQEKVQVMVADSVADETLDQVRALCEGKRVLVTLDSLHGDRHVIKELERYASLVSPGSYLIVQDTAIDRHPEWIDRFARYDGSEAGPAAAIERWLPEHPEFEVDKNREKFLFTFHPGGWLRRLETP